MGLSAGEPTHMLLNGLSIRRSSGGIKTFFTGLLQGFRELLSDVNVEVLCTAEGATCLEPVVSGTDIALRVVMARAHSSFVRVAWEQLALPLKSRARRAVLVSPNSMACIPRSQPQVVIVQDPFATPSARMQYAQLGGRIPFSKAVYFGALMPASLRRAGVVITVSSYLKRQLVKDYRISPEKLRIVHEGVDNDVFVVARPRTERPRKTILFVSTLFPYKNVHIAIEALYQLRTYHGLDVQLRIVGRDPTGSEFALVRQYAERRMVGHFVRIDGQLAHGDMPAVYADAYVLLYPSSFETFGLPVLEAMSCGIPVVTSDACSLPELVDDAGIVVRDRDVSGFVRALLHVLSDHRQWKEYAARGLVRAREFTWERTAAGVLAAVRSLG